MTAEILRRRADCRARHTGIWAMELSALRQSVQAVNQGLYRGAGEYAHLMREKNLIDRLEDGEKLRADELNEIVVMQGLTKQARAKLEEAWQESYTGSRDRIEITTTDTDIAPEAFFEINPGKHAKKVGGDKPPRQEEEEDYHETVAGPIRQRESKRRPFHVDDSGIAVIEIAGVMGKGFSKFFDVNTVEVRRAVRMAAEEQDVDGIMIVIDSPGGTVAGTAELADDIKAAAKKKRLRVHADDIMASAGYWIGVSAEKITASRTTEVGSIGTLLVVEDLSKAAEAAGIVVHVISTGAMKGAGIEGAEVTKEQLRMFQDRVEGLNQHFQADVSEGRNLRGAALEAVSDGRVFIADQAKQLGLINDVMSFDEAIGAFRRSIARAKAQRRRAAALAAEVEMDETDENEKE